MTFERLGYNPPIRYEIRPPCLSLNRLQEIVEDYCDWGNTIAYVPAGFTNCVEIRRKVASQGCLAWITCALKVASYFTLIIPALMHLAKYLLRSSEFYIISRNQNPIELQRLADGDLQIGQVGDDGTFAMGVHIHNGQVVEFMRDEPAQQQSEFIPILIAHHAQELISEAPVVVLQFLQRIASDPFVYQGLRIAYTPSSERIETTQTVFKRRVLETVIAYLAAKEDATLTEKWLYKALTDQFFEQAEFTSLDIPMQRDLCCLAKFFKQSVFWSRAESLLASQIQSTAPAVPNVVFEQVMTYVGEPYKTALVSRMWAHFTRNSAKLLLLDYFKDKRITSHFKQPHRNIVMINLIKGSQNYEILYGILENIFKRLNLSHFVQETDGMQTLCRYLLSPFNLRTVIALKRFARITFEQQKLVMELLYPAQEGPKGVVQALMDSIVFPSEAPLHILDFLHTWIEDPFVFKTLKYAYRQAVERLETVPSSFQQALLRAASAHLIEKPNPTQTEIWMGRALANDDFDADEFAALEPALQKATCLIAKYFRKETFWFKAENLLPRNFQRLNKITSVCWTMVMAYTAEPYHTAAVCHVWHCYTRNSFKLIALDFLSNRKITTLLRKTFSQTDLSSMTTDLSHLDSGAVKRRLTFIYDIVQSELEDFDPFYTTRLCKYQFTPLTIKRALEEQEKYQAALQRLA